MTITFYNQILHTPSSQYTAVQQMGPQLLQLGTVTLFYTVYLLPPHPAFAEFLQT